MLRNTSQVVIAVPVLAPFDAVGNDVRLERHYLNQAGFNTAVYAERCDTPELGPLISDAELQAALADPECTLIYHFCVYWQPLEERLREARCRVIIRYHNITPPHFYAPYDPGSVHATALGIKQAAAVLRHPKVIGTLATSPFTARDAARVCGSTKARIEVVPPFVPLAALHAASPDPTLARELDSDRVTAAFVGRFSPNKGHRHLIGIAASYAELFDRRLRLIMAGSQAPALDSYLSDLKSLVKDSGIDDLVEILPSLSVGQLKTLYVHSHAFIAMSEHEGFCVPVVEAQSFGTPVLALAQGAVADTVGDAQVTNPSPDYDFFASALHTIGIDPSQRAPLSQAARRNAQRYDESVTADVFINTLRPKFQS